MELKEGGYYYDGTGESYGPLRLLDSGYYPFTDGVKTWTTFGRSVVGKDSPADLIEEVEIVPPLITKTMVVSYVVADGRSFSSMQEAAQDLIAWRYMGENKPPMSQWIIDNREWLSALFKEVDNAE